MLLLLLGKVSANLVLFTCGMVFPIGRKTNLAGLKTMCNDGIFFCFVEGIQSEIKRKLRQQIKPINR